MAIPWFQQPEAQAILNRLRPQDLEIDKVLGYGLDDKHVPDRFEWTVMVDDIERRLEMFLTRQVDNDVGFTFEQAGDDYVMAKKWADYYEMLPSVQAVLNTKFGDPNILWGYGLDQARKIWKHDPLYLVRMREQQEQIAAVQDMIEKREGDKDEDEEADDKGN